MRRKEKTREVGGAKWDKEGRGREGQRRGAREHKKRWSPFSALSAEEEKQNRAQPQAHVPVPLRTFPAAPQCHSRLGSGGSAGRGNSEGAQGRGKGSRSRGRTRDGGSARKLRQIRPTHELPPPRHTRVPSTATWPRAEHVRRPAAHMGFQLPLTHRLVVRKVRVTTGNGAACGREGGE